MKIRPLKSSTIPLLFVIFLLTFLSENPAEATIPLAAKADARYELGYLVVTYYYGVNADGTDGYCGILGVPGRNSFIANVEIEGGKYGIYNNGNAAGAILVGTRLYNQTEFAITSEDFCPFSMVGLDIVTDAKTANSSSTQKVILLGHSKI